MKKLIITFVVALCAVSAFADLKQWNNTDLAALKKAVADPKTSKTSKVNYSVNIAYLENAKQFKTYADLKTFVIEKCKEFNVRGDIQAWITAQQVLCHNKEFTRFNKEAFEDCRNTFYGIFFAIKNKTGMSTQENWRYLSNIIINNINGIANHQRLTRVINYMINNDLRIQKAEKIEVYNMLYEKYLPKITDEQNLTNDKKVYTPILGKIAMKLKALGVSIIK